MTNGSIDLSAGTTPLKTQTKGCPFNLGLERVALLLIPTHRLYIVYTCYIFQPTMQKFGLLNVAHLEYIIFRIADSI